MKKVKKYNKLLKDGYLMKRYDDYKNPENDSKRKHDDELTNEEFSKIDWTKFKIVVPTLKDKKELEEAIHYLHNQRIDTDYIVVNQLVHRYLGLEEGYENNIIVDGELFDQLPEYRKITN